MISQCFHQLFLPEENNSKSVNRIIHAQVSPAPLFSETEGPEGPEGGGRWQKQQATASINKLFSQQKCTFFVLLFKTGYDNIWSVVKNRRTCNIYGVWKS